MNVLILGSGGREHAFAWKIAQSTLLTKLFIAPGNAGTLECGTNVDLKINDFNAIEKFVLEQNINLLLVGPEDPLVNGIHDYFLSHHSLKNVSIIGPIQKGAQLEGSKEFSKQFMQKHHIPTAAYKAFTKHNLHEAKAFLNTLSPPYVLKADGLAAGKGVLIIDSLDEALTELSNMILNQKFGNAGNTVVVEEFLKGIELSIFVLTDGLNYKILPTAKDYKRISIGDTGLNTGGMGAVSPVPFANKEFIEKVEQSIIKPTIEGLQKEQINYTGFIFIGLMNCNGTPYVIEYNCRMGDPETEVVIPRINSDLLEVLIATSTQKLNTIDLQIIDKTATTIVLASGGYPEAYEKNKVIDNIPLSNLIDDCILFHSGTITKNNQVLTNGGRVFAATGLGTSIHKALQKSLIIANQIKFENKYFRTDIGEDLM